MLTYGTQYTIWYTVHTEERSNREDLHAGLVSSMRVTDVEMEEKPQLAV